MKVLALGVLLPLFVIWGLLLRQGWRYWVRHRGT